MKVDAYGNIKPGSNVKKRGGIAQGGSFSSLLGAAETEETTQPANLSDIAGTSPLSGMLALQEMPEEDIRRKKLMRQGAEMLDTLEQLRRRLLLGSLPANILQDISRQLSLQRQEISDPRLINIIEEIELRAAVELTKLEMAIARKSVITDN